MDEIKLVKATLNDIDKILEVEKNIVGTKIYSGLTGSEDTIKELNENVYYLIEIDGKVVGNTSYQEKDKNHVYISGLAVAKEFQGKGIGKASMKILLEQLKEYKLIDLVTHPENKGAINLYKSLGFEQIGQAIPNYFDDGEPRIKMELKK
jgi:ribosomal protein S18 acetylase RimI-like enzyme